MGWWSDFRDSLTGKEANYDPSNIQAARNVPQAPTKPGSSTEAGFYNTFGSKVATPGKFHYTSEEAQYRQEFFQKYPTFYSDAITKMQQNPGMTEQVALQDSVNRLSHDDRRSQVFQNLFHSGRLVQTYEGSGPGGESGGAGSGGGGARSVVSSQADDRMEIDTRTAEGATDDKRQRKQALISTSEEGLLSDAGGSVGRTGLLGD